MKANTQDGVKYDKYFFKLFRNSSDSFNMNVDGSVTPVDFKVTCPDSGTVKLERINMVLIDTGVGYAEFGGLGSELSNGLTFKMFDSSDNLLIDFLDGLVITANAQFGLLAGPDSFSSTGSGPDYLPMRWTLGRSGHPLLMSPGDYIRVRVQDDLTGLYRFQMMAQGTQF